MHGMHKFPLALIQHPLQLLQAILCDQLAIHTVAKQQAPMQPDNGRIHLQQLFHQPVRFAERMQVDQPVAGKHPHHGAHAVLHALRGGDRKPRLRHIPQARALRKPLVYLHLEPEGAQGLAVFPHRQRVVAVVVQRPKPHGDTVCQRQGKSG